MTKKKVINLENPTNKIPQIDTKDSLSNYLYNNMNVVIDFSYDTAFLSCHTTDMDNYLKDEFEFINKFREIVSNVQKLSEKTLQTLINGKEYRHCHKVSWSPKAQDILKKLHRELERTEEYEQVFEGEEFFQFGLLGAVRFYGIIKANIFYVAFIDYYHSFDYDERYNERNTKQYSFCPMTSELSTTKVNKNLKEENSRLKNENEKLQKQLKDTETAFQELCNEK